MRQFVIGLAAALVLAAGCGGSSQSAAGTESAATIAPATTALYASIDTNLDSDQWNELEGLLNKFPDGDRLVDQIREYFGEEDIDVERDLKLALGPTVDLVLLGFENGADDLIGLTQPKDEAAFRALLEKADKPPVVREIEGWTAFADSAATLDGFEQTVGEQSLADSDRFQDAMADLPAEALAKVYVDGPAAMDALGELPGQIAIPTAYGHLVSAAAAVEAASDGLRLVGSAQTEGSTLRIPDLTLLEEVPAETIAFVNFHGFDGQLGLTSRLRDFTVFGKGLQEWEELLGVTLEDISTLLEKEAVLYVRRGALIPEVTLLLEVEDAAAAMRTLDALAGKATRLGASPPQERAVGDVEAKVVDFGQLSLYYAAFDGRLLVTTTEEGIRALREAGDKLVDDEQYERSLEAAGVGDDEEVVLWIDLDETTDLIEQVAALSGEELSPDVVENLRPLRSALASGSSNGSETTFRIFVEVE
jgi:Protein of unknown function (DUF3352)